MLAAETPELIHGFAAMYRNMPKNGGRFLRSSRYELLPTSPVPLGNTGVTPPAVTPDRVDIDVQMQFYGQYVILNEQCTLQNQDPALTAVTERLGVSMRMTEDELTRDMLAASAGFINCVGGGNGDNPTEITASDCAVAYQALRSNNAKTVATNIEGADKFGTSPIRNSYLAMCDSDLSTDIQNVNGFVHAAQYPQQANIRPSEWGNVQNLRFFTSSVGSITTAASAAGADVYNIFVTGMEAYMLVDQESYGNHFVYLPPEFSGPLALNASVGWKMSFASTITNDLWVLNLRTTRRF